MYSSAKRLTLLRLILDCKDSEEVTKRQRITEAKCYGSIENFDSLLYVRKRHKKRASLQA